MYLFTLKELERGRHRGIRPLAYSHMAAVTNTGQAHARSREFHSGNSAEYRGPSRWATSGFFFLFFFCRCVSKELDLKWSRQDGNQCPNGILAIMGSNVTFETIMPAQNCA